jgi:hypothetical protein
MRGALTAWPKRCLQPGRVSQFLFPSPELATEKQRAQVDATICPIALSLIAISSRSRCQEHVAVSRAAQYLASWTDLYFPAEQSHRGVEVRMSLPQIQSKFIERPKPRSELVG